MQKGVSAVSNGKCWEDPARFKVYGRESREVNMTLPVSEAAIDAEAGSSTYSGLMRVQNTH